MNPQDNIKYPLCRIMWKDAQSDSEWSSIEKIKIWAQKDCVINDIGWLVYEDKNHIVICSQIGEDGELGNRTKIPVGWVLKKEKVTFRYERSNRKLLKKAGNENHRPQTKENRTTASNA